MFLIVNYFVHDRETTSSNLVIIFPACSGMAQYACLASFVTYHVLSHGFNGNCSKLFRVCLPPS